MEWVETTLLLSSRNAGAICIAGNIVDRQPENGGNGLGCQDELSYTLTATITYLDIQISGLIPRIELSRGSQMGHRLFVAR